MKEEMWKKWNQARGQTLGRRKVVLAVTKQPATCYRGFEENGVPQPKDYRYLGTCCFSKRVAAARSLSIANDAFRADATCHSRVYRLCV